MTGVQDTCEKKWDPELRAQEVVPDPEATNREGPEPHAHTLAWPHHHHDAVSFNSQ
jgi:hypothetical protein